MTTTESSQSGQGTVEILVVDDSRVQATVLKNLLLADSYRVRVAGDGYEALKMMREQKPTLVISDVVMPKMDGYELCHQVKCDEVLKEIPVILLTSLSDPEDIVLGLNAQADAYLTKPYDSAFLLSTIESTLHGIESAPDDAGGGIGITLGARHYTVSAGRRQMLRLLLSTYGNAVQQNRVLLQTQRELKTLNAQLKDQAQRIEEQQQKLQEANERLQLLATNDGLTGLKNHRAFKERLEEEIRRAVREKTPLALMMIDVDAFKTFNDTFGHPAGDEVLREVARHLRDPLRITDFVARYGGEEFAVLLPNTNAAGALMLAERLRSNIENAPWPQRAITASFGVSVFQTSPAELGKFNPDSGALLLAATDKALYQSKHGGRNRVSYNDTVTSP